MFVFVLFIFLFALKMQTRLFRTLHCKKIVVKTTIYLGNCETNILGNISKQSCKYDDSTIVK